jgi:transcriptional regulator with XRE-family HTH domain
MSYRLRAEVLREAAAKRGDDSVRRIVKATGIDRSVIQRNLGGLTEPSLGTLMRLRECYGVSIEDLIKVLDVAQAAAA